MKCSNVEKFLDNHTEKEVMAKLEKYPEYFDGNDGWEIASLVWDFHENFVRKYKDKLNWKNVSSHKGMSEAFIEEMKDYVDWNEISLFQNLSEKFVRKHENQLTLNYLVYNENLSEEYRKHLKEICNFKE